MIMDGKRSNRRETEDNEEEEDGVEDITGETWK